MAGETGDEKEIDAKWEEEKDIHAKGKKRRDGVGRNKEETDAHGGRCAPGGHGDGG